MMGQLVQRMTTAAISMSPEHLIDKLLNWLDELRSAMALAESDKLARSEGPTRVLFD